METKKYDLIIMGGGLAGLSAGVRACELGLSVALVEKGETAVDVTAAFVVTR